jgi:hypothetical protein
MVDNKDASRKRNPTSEELCDGQSQRKRGYAS